MTNGCTSAPRRPVKGVDRAVNLQEVEKKRNNERKEVENKRNNERKEVEKEMKEKKIMKINNERSRK